MSVSDFFCLNPKYSTTRMVTQEQPRIKNDPSSKVHTKLFLPSHPNRQGEGGLRTKGYFKKSFNDKPLVTVITVVFNGQKSLEQTIQSVLRQSCDNVEYIIIDGGSTDGTLDIIQKYEEVIDYWISESDKGIYDAMNKGIDLATGEWINFLNAGDKLYNDNILCTVFCKNDVSKYFLIYGDSEIFDKNAQKTMRAKKFTKTNLLFWTTRVLCHQSIFVRKSSIVYYSSRYKLKGELNWYFDLMEANENKLFKKMDEVLVKYLLGGIGEVNFLKNSRETFKVLFDKVGILGVLAHMPLFFYKFILRFGVSSIFLRS